MNNLDLQIIDEYRDGGEVTKKREPVSYQPGSSMAQIKNKKLKKWGAFIMSYNTNEKFALTDKFEAVSNEVLEETVGGIGGALGQLLNGFANAMNTWNTTGFPGYNIGGSSSNRGTGGVSQYNPYNDF